MRNRFTDRTNSKGHDSTSILLSASLLLSAAVIGAVLYAGGSISRDTSERERESIERAIERDITGCYALEGVYPPSLDYIKEHYGLSYPEDRYFIDYRPVGGNLRPSYTIIDLSKDGQKGGGQ